MTPDQLLAQIKQKLKNRPTPIYHTEGTDGNFYYYAYGGMGEWMTMPIPRDMSTLLRQLLENGRLTRGEDENCTLDRPGLALRILRPKDC